jgi:hypothetical protein
MHTGIGHAVLRGLQCDREMLYMAAAVNENLVKEIVDRQRELLEVEVCMWPWA